MKFHLSFARPANLQYFIVFSFMEKTFMPSSIWCPQQLFEVVRADVITPILQIRKQSPWLVSRLFGDDVHSRHRGLNDLSKMFGFPGSQFRTIMFAQLDPQSNRRDPMRKGALPPKSWGPLCNPLNRPLSSFCAFSHCDLLATSPVQLHWISAFALYFMGNKYVSGEIFLYHILFAITDLKFINKWPHQK